MAGNRMMKICRQHEHSFLKSLKEAASLKEKPVHRLRVDVKNFRVLLQLHALLSKKSKSEKKMRRLLAPLFRSAGKMRSAALNLRLTVPYRSPALLKFRRSMKEK